MTILEFDTYPSKNCVITPYFFIFNYFSLLFLLINHFIHCFHKILLIFITKENIKMDNVNFVSINYNPNLYVLSSIGREMDARKGNFSFFYKK